MTEFRYSAYDGNGRIAKGRITAQDEAAALHDLNARRLTVFEIGQSIGDADIAWWSREITITGDRVPRAQLAQFLESFSILLKAKLPIPMALSSAVEEVKHPRLRAILVEANRSVAEGGDVSSPIATHPEIVPNRIAVLIALGERSNQLQMTTQYAAELMKRELRFRKEVSAALTYPIILLVVALVVILGLVFLLAPTLAPVFSAVGKEPPIAIAMMLSTKDVLVQQWPIVAGGIVVAGLLFGVLAQRASRQVEQVLFRLPLIGTLIRISESSRSLMTLSLMSKSGAPVLEALAAAREASTTQQFREMYQQMEEAVRAGDQIASALDADLLPKATVQMIRLGERSDHLDEMLENAVDALDRQSREKIQSLLQLLTPVLTLVIGVVVGALIFSTLSAILEINDVAFE
ncbi:MAG: type II secretion system F family protein [Pseudomonadota bacterium]